MVKPLSLSDNLLKIRLSGVAEQNYTVSYGKSQLIPFISLSDNAGLPSAGQIFGLTGTNIQAVSGSGDDSCVSAAAFSALN